MADDQPSFSLSDNRLRPTVARISLWTADIDRLEAFYTKVFGFERIFARRIAEPTIVGSWHFPPDSEMDIVLLRSPRGETELGLSTIAGVEIAQRATVRDGTPFAGTPYLVFYVPSLDAVLMQLDDLAAAINRPAKKIYDGDGRMIYEAAIYDPDGTVILVVQDIKAPEPR
jgi:catechol 2,3-dioxygenase-like lactoylglutathione lyase family enzyme